MCAAKTASPVLDDELETLFAAFPVAGQVILAVSGGADSTALLVLAQRWRARRADGPQLIAATVDHALRPGSRDETERVAALAKNLGVPHRIIAWEGEKPATGIEAAARTARRALLGALAKEIGARHLATAHTLDDQAETVLMRLAAGSGPAGLAAMRAREQRDDLTLLRPFLGLRKARLVATLARDGLAWSEDPMNADPRFARARLRAARRVLEREGFSAERLARLAARMARSEEVVSRAAAAARENLQRGVRPGGLNGAALLDLPEELALRVLAAEIVAVAGDRTSAHPIRLARLETLWGELRRALATGRAIRRTLAGALIAADRHRVVQVTRAPLRRTVALRKRADALGLSQLADRA